MSKLSLSSSFDGGMGDPFTRSKAGQNEACMSHAGEEKRPVEKPVRAALREKSLAGEESCAWASVVQLGPVKVGFELGLKILGLRPKAQQK